MPENGSGGVVCSSSLLLCGHPGRRQAETCMGHTGVKPGTVRPDSSQPLILVYCSLALVRCTTTQGELATGRRPSRHILVFGGSRGSRQGCRPEDPDHDAVIR